MITKKQADFFVDKYDNFYCKEIDFDGTKIFLYNYILSDYEVFQKEPLSRELRGLVINEDSEVFLSVPKFFNINEIPETLDSKLKNKLIKNVTDKLDGSLITPIRINGDVVMKSKASFESDQALLAQELLDPELKYFILDCWDNNFQPYFELVGVDNEHVIEYNFETRLDLIMVRDKYGHFIDINKFNYKNKTKEMYFTLDEMLEKQQTDKNIEGWVVQFEDGEIIKIKTLDFFEKHKIKEQSDSYKSVLKLCLNEDLDDVLSIVSEAKKEKIKKINNALVHYVSKTIKELNDIDYSVEQKELALKYKPHEYFSVIMQAKKGKDTKESLINFLLQKYNKEQKAKEFIQGL
jgi:T4 RnlA family RNA ligase